MPRRTSLPPVDGRAGTNQAGREPDVGEVAELPQLLRSTAVVEDDLVDLEGIELARTDPVASVGYPLDELGQPSRVITGNHLDRGPPLRRAGHPSTTDPTAVERYLDATTSQWQNRALPVVPVDSGDVSPTDPAAAPGSHGPR